VLHDLLDVLLVENVGEVNANVENPAR
jgi:hypothetical protein